ncbi:MAG: histidine--tRNA ligase, partial [Saprospiraceae bacterium]|nr:histidine--tRNA ligase [Saprospiraceae bacterium]
MKPSILKGTRDFGPEQVRRRNFIFETIRNVFIKYGFQPIETPAMENLQTLTGKYGEEGDKLLFKVLNNGDYLRKANEEALESRDSRKLISSISKRGMRYDLTVPFARFVVMHQNDITFPFKRYQIQPVWRADNPQKGRYQEFYQCDADVVGSNSLIYEAELSRMFVEVFEKLGINALVKLNNRKILAGLAEMAGVQDKMMEMTIALDKLDKIGLDGVKRELASKGIEGEAQDFVISALERKNLDDLAAILKGSEIGEKGIEEMRKIFSLLPPEWKGEKVTFDITLARGLNYYTGCIFEVETTDIKIGSVGGGGRYDDLTAVFGLKNVSGVGISFGADRIYDVL